jgi:hypothetical protein
MAGSREREYQTAIQRIYALPLAWQHRALDDLTEHLGLPIGRMQKEARLRGQAVADIRTAAEWLDLPPGVAPKVDDYKRAARELGLMGYKQAHEAWELFGFAQDAIEGKWVPESPARRAHRRRSSGKKRPLESHMHAIRVWQPPPERHRQHDPGVDDDPLVVKDDIRSVRQIVHHASDLLVQAAVAPNDRFLPAQEVISLHTPDGTPPPNGGSRLSVCYWRGASGRGPLPRARGH